MARSPLEEALVSSVVGERALLMSNQAIARGAIEAGAKVVTGYPGTPSSEIIEALAPIAESLGMHLEWAINEKVGLEVASAAAIAGVRGMTVMKHVGLNVASDILMVLGLSGVNGGMVIVVGDDPGGWVSQNEQDSRLYARMADLPMLEPSTPQEALRMTVMAFDVSERLKLPVFVRTTLKVSHSSGIVRFGPIRKTVRKGEYVKDVSRYYVADVVAQARHEWQHLQLRRARKLLKSFKLNPLHLKKKQKHGIVASADGYNYAVEALRNLDLEDRVAVLKVETSHPLPDEKLRTMLRQTKDLLVVEETEPVMEDHLRMLTYGLPQAHVRVHGKRDGALPETNDLSYEIVESSLASLCGVRRRKDRTEAKFRSDIAKATPPRGWTLCAGCPHLGTFYALKMLTRKVSGRRIPNIGDIGCMGLAALPPLEIVDTSFCMGSSIAQASGLAYAGVNQPIVASIGDSTFFHSGIPPLIDAVANNAQVCVLICDNETTAMTGHQPHPGIGISATGKPTRKVDIEGIVRAAGVDHVATTNAFDVFQTYRAIETAMKHHGPSVVISRGRCAELSKRDARKTGSILRPLVIDAEKCRGYACGVCITEFGCPAIVWNREIGKAAIDPSLCVGCNLCAQVCVCRAIDPGLS